MEAAFSENQPQNPLTTKDTKGTEENQNSFTAKDAEDAKKERVRQRAGALVRRIGETCDELDRLAEENPELVGRVTRGAEEHKDAYVRLKARLELADEAPRCRWVKQDGTSCGSPQMKKHIYCFAHRQMMEARALALSLPAPEDANAIQIGIMRIQKALIEGTISTKMAGLLLYSMQLALQNVGQVTFGQAKTQELVRETVDEEVAFSQNRTPTTETPRHGEETGQNQHQNQGPFTTEDAKNTERNKTLPLMNADDADFETGGNASGIESEFVPMAGGYGFHKVRLKIEPELGVERRIGTSGDRGIGTPPRAAVPHEDRQMHANLG